MTALTTIVFTTHNRSHILRQAIQAAKKQSVPVKIIVMDDASTDETPIMMAQEFPEIEYYRSSENKGPCYHRNQGIQLAKTEIVFPLDDDSILQSPYTIEQTLKEFDNSHIGAVAIPFINILQDQKVWQQAPNREDIYWTHAYVAAAHAIHRENFLKTGGYREFFFYMGEEGDLCIRLLQNGFAVRLGNADPIHHLQPPNRISMRADTFGRQNDIVFVYCNTPLSLLIPHLIGTLCKGFIFGLRVKRPWYMLHGFYHGFKLIFDLPNIRKPVKLQCFQLYRFLKKNKAKSLSEIQKYLLVN
jgi:glycosyltransferase involved in cell wall biosynthesis